MNLLKHFAAFGFGLALSITAAFGLPTIITPSPTQFVTLGETATIATAGTVSSGTLTYQWAVSFDGGTTLAPISDGPTYSGTTTDTLTISNIGISLNGAAFYVTYTQTGGTGPGGRITSASVYVVQDLPWDAGLTEEGTNLAITPADTSSTTPTGHFYYKFTTQATAVGAWRTVLRNTSGTADLYLKRDTPPTSTTDYNYRSANAGTTGDGVVLLANSFAEGQTWYIMVAASSDAAWSLVSGEPYVQDLGVLADDASSSAPHATIGAEGQRFFRTSTPASAAAWQVWLNDGATPAQTLKSLKLAVRRAVVPEVDRTYDHQQAGHMLLVPPYLNTGGDTYFLSVKGTPGTQFSLDSRRLPATPIAFGDSATFSLPTSGYAVYRTTVPIDQIGWQTELQDLSRNVDVAVRRDNAASEWFNDAFSESPGTAGDSVTLVPPSLSDGTYYITLYNAGDAATGRLQNRVPFEPISDDVPFLGTSLNDEPGLTVDDPNPNKVGWRYFRVGVADPDGIQAQLGVAGWKLALADASGSTEIALRRNFLPGKGKKRNAFNGTAQDSDFYRDFNSFTGELSRIGHQADIWYVGVYSPVTPLGNFALTRTAIEAGETLDVPFDAGSTSITDHQPDTWRYFKFEVPEDSNLLGWDLRVEDRTGGAVTAQVTRAVKPEDGLAADFTLGSFWTRTQEPNGSSDPDKYIIKAYNGRGPTGSELNSNGGRGWLYAGTYYLGVKVSSAAASYTVTSRAIGTADSSYPIQAGVLDFAAGSVDITNLAVRDVAFYRIDVPEGAKTWELKLEPTGTGEASIKLSNTGRIPSFDEPSGQGPDEWASAEKRGNDYIHAVKNSNVLQAGTYYVAVTGEGDSPPSTSRVGTGAISATLTSTSDMPVTPLGTATTTPITEAVEVESEAVKLYQFTVAPDTLNVEIRLTDRVGNPRFTVQPGDLPSGWGSSADAYTLNSFRGSSSGTISDSLITLANPTAGTYTVAVRALNTTGTAYPDATATLSVVATAAADVAFADGTVTVSDQANGTWRYFRFDVPEATDLLGWDLRVQDVTGGSIASAQVLRELPPGDGISTDFTLSSFWTRSQEANGTNDPDKYLVKAYDGRGPTPAESGGIFGNNGRGWLYAGTYYLGVKVSGTATSYTVSSRGIGLEASTYPIKVAGDLAFTDGVAQITELAPRETAIYRVTVPEGAQTWSLTLEPEGTGEASIKFSGTGRIPGTSEPYAQRDNLWGVSPINGGVAHVGTDRFYVAQSSPTSSTRLPPGTYYVTVVGEGDSPTQPTRIGTGAINATLSSVSDIPVTDMGEITPTATVSPVDIASGELSFYRFSVAPDTLSLEIKLTDKTGSPQFTVVAGDLPANYPVSGTTAFSATLSGGASASGYDETLTSLGNPAPGTYTVVVGTRGTSTTGATANLSIAAGSEQVLTFNDGSVTVTGQEAGTWRYFKVQVPEGEDLLGWDLRILNPDGGNGSLLAYVKRDTPPNPAANHLNDFGFTSYWGRSQEADGSPDKNLYLIKSNNVPGPSTHVQGWFYPGTYYIGVLARTGGYVIPDEYTIVSRGIGTEDSPFSIKVAGDLDFTDGTVQITGLAPRETAIYRVTVPEGAQTWALRLDPEGTGEASFRVSNTGRIPVFSDVWADASKPGTDFVYAADNNSTFSSSLPAGTYYVSVIGEGNSPATSSRFGVGTINAVLTSISDIPITSVGTASATESVTPVTLDAEEVKLYRFNVEPGATSLEVRLTERTGNPRVAVAFGELPGGWAALGQFKTGSTTRYDAYGYTGSSNYFGGATGTSGDNLITLTNPSPGTYTVTVRAVQSYVYPSMSYTDATANLRVVTRAPATLNFSALQNASGGTNTTPSTVVSDGERTFYEITVPETLGDSAPLGWKLSAATSQGSVGLYVYSDSSNLTTPIASTTERTLIIAPPLLKAGSFIVEARATGATEFTLTSESIVPRNADAPWELPTADTYSSAADVGDTGAVDLANGDYDFYVLNVPEGNLGLLRTVIEAISGNPDLYIRRNAIPSRNHGAPGETNSGYAYSRYSAQPSGTEYGNWVPFDDKTETQLKPGTYYLAVHAASNTNLRYRLRVSPGDVQTLALNGGSASNQLLTGGDWRYYRFAVPADNAVPQSWTLNFTQNSGDAIVHIRDTVPAGQTTNVYYQESYLRDWQNDRKNGSTSLYGRFDAPGPITINTPPLRPGSIYYVGFYAKTDSSIGLSSSTTGTMADPPILDYYTGSVTNGTIPAGGEVLYRMIAPPEAGRLRFNLTPSATITVDIEQGTFPATSGSIHYHNTSWTPTTAAFNEALDGWPWVPNTTYYLRLSNPSGSPVSFDFTSDSGAATIISSPVHTTVDVGETSRFTVVAGGSPAPTYQWRRNNQDLTDGGRFSGTNAATLVIANTQTADYGSYTVVVSNATVAGETYSSTTQAVTLSVQGAPLVLGDIGNRAVSVGGSTYFTANAYSFSNKTYQWQRSTDDGETWEDLQNGPGLSGAQAGRVNLSGITAEQNGELYRLRYTNAFGSSTTEPALLQVTSTPTIETQPDSASHVAGETATFTVVASGLPDPIYQWQKSGADINGATSATFVLENVQPENIGSYRVRISNEAGTTYSNNVSLTVRVPVTFTAQPEATIGVKGTNISFTATATGLPAPTYQWRKDEEPISGATSHSLTVRDIQLTDAGVYDVVATNSEGSVTSTGAMLTVNIPPTIQTQPQSTTQISGANATFAVGTIGTPSPTYQWQRNGVDIPGATASTLILTNVQSATAGNYRVRVTNAAGSLFSSYASLTVQVPPTFTTQPSAQTVIEGKDVTFSALATGSPAPTYQWRKNGVAISGATSSTLSLRNVHRVDAGTYDVVATNGAGSIPSASAVLTVHEAISITTQPVAQSVRVGARVEFTAGASGFPAPTYQWRKDGNPIPNATTEQLVLENVRLSAAGNYDVVITNVVGSRTSTSVKLTVTPQDAAPEIIVEPTDQNVAAGSAARFEVTATGYPLPTYQWRRNGIAISGATQAFYAISSVNSSHLGTYEVAVANTFGTEDSRIVRLTTISDSSAPVILAHPRGTTAQIGEAVTLTVSASGNPAPTYQWFTGEAEVPGANTPTLTFPEITAAEAGAYHVRVSNTEGEVTSQAATVRAIARRYTGVYFGSFGPGRGSFAIFIRPDNTGVLVGFDLAANLFLRVDLTVDDSGGFTVVLDNNPVAAKNRGILAATNITLSGQIGDGGSLSGSVAGVDGLSLSGNRETTGDAPTGFYEAKEPQGDAETYSIVSSDGQVITILQTAEGRDGGVGTVDAQGMTSMTTALGLNLETTFKAANTTQITTLNDGQTERSLVGASAAQRANQRLLNISSRTRAGSEPGAEAIAGLAIGGQDAKLVLIRAVGPSLAKLYVTDTLAKPELELYQDGKVIARNEGWTTAANSAELAAAASRVYAFPLIADSTDSVILATLQPGLYTAVARGADGGAGIVLIEVYDLTNPVEGQKLINISTRAAVGTGDNVCIAGLVIGGALPKKVLIRGSGPNLTKLGVPNVLENPQIEVYQNGEVIAANDDWGSDPTEAEAVRQANNVTYAFALTEGSQDAAMVITLAPGIYSIILSGVNQTTGIGLVEIYEMP